jgi:hypothetical protein
MPAEPRRSAPELSKRRRAASRGAGLMLVFLLTLAPLMTSALAQDTPDQPAVQDDSTPSDMSAPSDQPSPADATGPVPTDQSQPTIPTAIPTAAPTPIAAPAPGQVLLTDDFHDASAGVLPASAANSPDGDIVPAGSYSIGYVGGGYEFKKLQVPQTTYAFVQLPNSYSNVSIDVDTQFSASNANTFVWITCRAVIANSIETGYRANMRPDSGSFNIYRFDSGTPFFLMGNTSTDKLRRSPATNHLQMNCVGSSISVALNGTVVATVQDPNYASGVIRIGTGAPGNSPDTLHLANLVVTQR